MKNSRVLVLAGALIVAVGIGFYFGYNTHQPNGKDLGGAIGAVQKYSSPQIAPADVILGDEQFRNEVTTLYAGFLEDAAALEARSTGLGIFARGINVKADNLEAFRADALAIDQELESRYAEATDGAIGMADLLIKQQGLEAFQADLQAVRADLAIVKKLDAKQLDGRAQLLARMSKDIAARAAEANELEVVARDVNGIVSRIENREAKLDAKQLAAMEAELEKCEQALELHRRLDVRMLQSRIDRLEARFREIRALAEARVQITALSKLEGVKVDVLEARQQDLLELSKRFVGIAESLEARAMANMQARHEDLAARADQITGIRTQMVGLKKGIEARAESIEAREMQEAAARFDLALEAKHAQIGSRVNETMQAELALIDKHFDSHVQLEARMQSTLAGAKVQAAGARSADLAELGLVADLQGIRHQLAALDRNIEMSAFVKAEQKSQLDTKVQQIEAKSKDL